MPPQQSKISSIEKVILSFLLLAAVVVIIAAVFGKHGLLTYTELNTRYQSMQDEVARLKDENARLKTEIEALKSDPEAIERVAREELGMIKPGEVLYRIKRKDEPVEEQGPVQRPGTVQQSNREVGQEHKP